MYETLFVGGCARSGTTALRKWLNASQWFYIGNERYAKLGYQPQGLSNDLFKPDRFLNIRDGDSAIPQAYIEKDKQRILKTVELGGVFGDKIPRLADIKPSDKFNRGKVKNLVIVRNIFDVASSYKARAEEGRHWASDRGAMVAVRDWNRSLVWASQQVKKPDTFVMGYESFFFGEDEPKALYEFLEVPKEHIATLNESLLEMRKASAQLETRRKNILSPTERVGICTRGKFGIYGKLLNG